MRIFHHIVHGDEIPPWAVSLRNQSDLIRSNVQMLQHGVTDIMSKLDGLQADMATLRAKVEAETAIDQSAIALITGLVTGQKALADEIAALRADTVTQEQIDAVAQSARDTAAVAEQNSTALAAAVQANTPAA